MSLFISSDLSISAFDDFSGHWRIFVYEIIQAIYFVYFSHWWFRNIFGVEQLVPSYLSSYGIIQLFYINFSHEAPPTQPPDDIYCIIKVRVRASKVFLIDPFVYRIPTGDDKSRINRTEVSGLRTAPKGDTCTSGNGGSSKGPEVCPRSSSLWIAADTPSLCSMVLRALQGLVSHALPRYPTSNPNRKPCNT